MNQGQGKHDSVGLCLVLLCSPSASVWWEAAAAGCLWNSLTFCLPCSRWGGVMHCRALHEEVLWCRQTLCESGVSENKAPSTASFSVWRTSQICCQMWVWLVGRNGPNSKCYVHIWVVQWLALSQHNKNVWLWVPWRPEVFLRGVCMFSLWLRGFSQGSLASSHSLSVCVQGKGECVCKMVCFCVLSRDGLVTCLGFTLQLGQAPAPTSHLHPAKGSSNRWWMDGCVNAAQYSYSSTVTENFCCFLWSVSETVQNLRSKHINPDHHEETNINSTPYW